MDARKRLKAWILNHTNQTRFADEIGIHEAYLSQILSGNRTPGLPILALIEEETGIPINSWVPRSHGKVVRSRKNQRKSANVGGEKSRAAAS